MKPNILRGDTGFPSIHLVNAEGTVFRFARGNLKDFFDFRKANTPQRIKLPVSSFVYDKDLKNNVLPRGDFFEQGIVKIYFDFLKHENYSIDMEISNFELDEIKEKSIIDVQSVVNFERTSQTFNYSKFSTRVSMMSFAVSLTSSGIYLNMIGNILSIDIVSSGNILNTISVILSEESKSIKFELPKIGAYWMRASIFNEMGEVCAQSNWPIVRVFPSASSGLPDVLGVSDSFCYDQIAALGGSWDRAVLTLNAIPAPKERLNFNPGTEPLPMLPPGTGKRRVMAVFGMSKWLSSKADAWDYSRYGPSDWSAYYDLVFKLVEYAYKSGVTHYEVWNEATALGHWNDDFQTLMKLHEVTASAARAAVPEMKILGACTHTWTYEYIEKFLKAGGADHCDGIAIHGYTYQPEEFVDQFDMVEKLLRKYTSHKPDFGAYITEIGFRVPAFSEDDQAYWFIIYTLETAARNLFKAILWFRFANRRPEIRSGYRQDASAGYAMTGYNDTYCRPALAGYSVVERLLGRADDVHATGSAEQRTYKFYENGCLFAIVSRSVDVAHLDPAFKHPCIKFSTLSKAAATLYIAIAP